MTAAQSSVDRCVGRSSFRDGGTHGSVRGGVPLLAQWQRQRCGGARSGCLRQDVPRGQRHDEPGRGARLLAGRGAPPHRRQGPRPLEGLHREPVARRRADVHPFLAGGVRDGRRQFAPRRRSALARIHACFGSLYPRAGSARAQR